MKLIRISLWHIPVNSQATYYMAGGKRCDTIESVVLAIDTDTGHTGSREVCPIPHYLPAYARGVAPTLQEITPILFGADPVGPEAVTARQDKHLPGHAYVKSAIDIALWDLTAQAARLPLHALLDGRQGETLPLYHSITFGAPDQMAQITVAAGCMDAVAIKLPKFCGFWAARRARDLCLRLGAATDPTRLPNVCDLSGYVSLRLAPAHQI